MPSRTSCCAPGSCARAWRWRAVGRPRGATRVVIEVRAAPERLRGPKALDVAPVLGSVLRAARESSAALDLSRLRVVCDWVQYRHNFREPVAARPILPSAIEAARASRNGAEAPAPAPACELALDLRRTAGLENLDAMVAAALRDGGASTGRVYLEDWTHGSRSCIW